MSVCDLKRAVKSDVEIQILDVRNPGEWEKNHIEVLTYRCLSSGRDSAKFRLASQLL